MLPCNNYLVIEMRWHQNIRHEQYARHGAPIAGRFSYACPRTRFSLSGVSIRVATYEGIRTPGEQYILALHQLTSYFVLRGELFLPLARVATSPYIIMTQRSHCVVCDDTNAGRHNIDRPPLQYYPPLLTARWQRKWQHYSYAHVFPVACPLLCALDRDTS